MTDEERQKLCDSLRHLPPYLSERGFKAADEIERLMERLKHAEMVIEAMVEACEDQDADGVAAIAKTFLGKM